MLSDSRLDRILQCTPGLTIGVVGDLFLDRYLDIDAGLTEPSIETGLDAYQVVRVRPSPGAAGTIINNLVALGVAQVVVVAVIGADGEGYELNRALDQLRVVDCQHLVVADDPGFRTPTYTKPMLGGEGQAPRELNRLDIKNRQPLGEPAEAKVVQALDDIWPKVSALLVLDQVSEEGCGVITPRVRDKLAELGHADPKKMLLVDSRERIGLFRSVWLKPNEAECIAAVHKDRDQPAPSLEFCAEELMQRARRPIFCTGGERGILLADPRAQYPWPTRIPAYSVDGPIDVVGAGDSASAALACAVAAGARLKVAAAFANLVASITIQQIGTTGTATPDQVRERWQQIRPAEEKPEQHVDAPEEAEPEPPRRPKHIPPSEVDLPGGETS